MASERELGEQVIIDEMNFCVREVIEHLPHDYRAAIVLHDLQGLTAEETARAGVTLEHHWYDGAGHLFTDPSRPDEYDPAAAELLWTRVLDFLARL